MSQSNAKNVSFRITNLPKGPKGVNVDPVNGEKNLQHVLKGFLGVETKQTH